MDDMTRRVGEQMKREAARMEELNPVIPVRGIRERVRLEGRTIDTVFYPAGVKSAPIIFAFHGGGYLFGGCALDDNMHHTLRDALKANVVSVGYRTGEEHPFPCAVDDGYDTMKHYIEGEGVDHEFDRSRIATFGSSAGGNMAVATSILARRRKEFRVGMQILNYPFLDAASPVECKGYAPEDIPMFRYFNEAHATPEQWRDPLMSPILAGDGDFDRALRVVVIPAEKDPLRHEAEIYANRLRNLGIDVAEHVAAGQGHGYFEFAFHDAIEGYCPAYLTAAAADGSIHRERDAALNFITVHWERWIGKRGCSD
ncbi:MAG: alpha/beta hydrolase fold domain-containing protein [Thermoleophilia bacterium]|nr:alpha/beta hydrolase fold domain-containing protein [Thermoleophilia bacterium]